MQYNIFSFIFTHALKYSQLTMFKEHFCSSMGNVRKFMWHRATRVALSVKKKYELVVSSNGCKAVTFLGDPEAHNRGGRKIKRAKSVTARESLKMDCSEMFHQNATKRGKPVFLIYFCT